MKENDNNDFDSSEIIKDGILRGAEVTNAVATPVMQVIFDATKQYLLHKIVNKLT